MSKDVNRAKVQLLLADISQAEISRKAGVSHAFVSQVVCGHKKPSKKLLGACRELGLAPELLGWGDSNASS